MAQKIFSADSHIDICWLPGDLFTSRASKEFVDRMPFVTEIKGKKTWVNKEGMQFGQVGGLGHTGRPYVKGQAFRADRIASTGLFEDGQKGVLRPSDPHLRVKDQDLDGISCEAIFGILGLSLKVPDIQVQNHMLQIYNEWLAEFCATYPDRFCGVTCCNHADVDFAVKTARFTKEKGLSAIEIPGSALQHPIWDPYWYPLWETVSELSLPVCLHTIPTKDQMFPNLSVPLEGMLRHSWVAAVMTVFQLNTADLIGGLCFGGVLEKFPKMKIVLGESGLGWIPYLLDRMDTLFEEQHSILAFKRKPSQMFHDQIFVSFQSEKIDKSVVQKIGIKNVMWATDYPHPDGIFPDSRSFLENDLKDFTPEEKSRIVYDNAKYVFGLAR